MLNIDDRILSEVDENQLFLLCAIAKHMGNNAKAWPSNKTLCETTRWSANKLQRVKKSAIEAGILGAESRFQNSAQTSNVYQIKTRRIGIMVNLADIVPHPQNGVPTHPQNDTPAPPQNGAPPHPQNGGTEVLTNEVLTNEPLKETLAENEFPQAIDEGLMVTVFQGHSEILPPVAKKKKKAAQGAGDGVIQAMVTAFETEHRQHFKDAGGEWIGFTWQAKEFPALNSIRAELEKRYRQKLNTEPTPENIVESWAMFLRKAAKCDKFILDNLFTPSKIWGQFQSIVQKIHTNNGRPPSTTSNGRPDQNERNRIAAEKMVQDVLEGRV